MDSPHPTRPMSDEPRAVVSTGYAQVPYWMVDKLPAQARHRHLWVYVALRYLAWQKPVPRSIEDVMKRAKVSRAAAYDSVRVLTEIGALVEQTRKGVRMWFLPVDNPSSDEDESRYLDDDSKNRDDPSRYLDTHLYSQENVEEEGKKPAPTGAVVAARSDLALPDDVAPLCELLAERIGAHGKVGRPVVNAAWRRDMSLLLRRGAKDVEPAALPAERVARAIDYVFAHLADPDTRGFCWADQVRSPGALRRHWTALVLAGKRHEQAKLGTSGRTLVAAREGPSEFGAWLNEMERRTRGGDLSSGATDTTRAVTPPERGTSNGSR